MMLPFNIYVMHIYRNLFIYNSKINLIGVNIKEQFTVTILTHGFLNH